MFRGIPRLDPTPKHLEGCIRGREVLRGVQNLHPPIGLNP